MSLKVIGAGLGRTGTMSLKIALEELLGGPCYHMAELLQHHLEEHTPLWHAAARGETVDWDQLFEGYVAAVDEPVSIQWQAITTFYPDALVVLSVREPDNWWKSASETIFEVVQRPRDQESPARQAWQAMVGETYKTLYPQGITSAEAAKAGFKAHLERVRSGIPSHRLLEWEVSQGWEPLCAALDLPIPDKLFPQSNSMAEFKARRPRPV